MRLVLAGDTMLGRGVAERLAADPAVPLVDPRIAEAMRAADLVVLNLECCISSRGKRFPDRRKPFFFRAPPVAAARLAELGVACVTLANNHALDFGDTALLDTFGHLAAAGIRWVGAGPDAQAARRPLVLEAAGMRLGIVAFSDHPAAFAAGRGRPGIAFADLRRDGVPGWLLDDLAIDGADAVLVLAHWGPNMIPAPLPYVRRAAEALVDAGASLVAGHSAHVFHGAQGRVLYDLGDFVDDYAVDPALRNDLGLLWTVDLEPGEAIQVHAEPLALDFCFTRPAAGPEHEWVARRFADACAELGTPVRREDACLAVTLDPSPPRR